jgi:cobalamin biosynthesis Mg chelatase CobN
MRQISWHIQLLTVLAMLCFATQSLVTTTAWGAAENVSLSSSEKAELDKQVQEQLAKAKTGQNASSAPGTPGAGSTGEGPGGSAGGSSNLVQRAEAEATTEEPATKTTATSSTESSGISMSVLVPIFIAGALLLGGIAFLIVRDARNVAPVGDGLVSGSIQEKAARQRKRRAKAKAARQQRKRNR